MEFLEILAWCIWRFEVCLRTPICNKKYLYFCFCFLLLYKIHSQLASVLVIASHLIQCTSWTHWRLPGYIQSRLLNISLSLTNQAMDGSLATSIPGRGNLVRMKMFINMIPTFTLRDIGCIHSSCSCVLTAIPPIICQQVQGLCQSELQRTLERLAASQTRTHEDLYLIPIPNCDQNGNFHPKQVTLKHGTHG